MEHVAIDLGASRSAVCWVSSAGEIVRELTVNTREIDRFLAKLPSGSRIVMESCAESRAVALIARKLNHEARVVPTSVVRALGVGTRHIKTDKRDALNLAMASFRLGDHLPQIHVRGDEAAAMQDLVSTRASLVAMKTVAVNFVRGQLRKNLLQSPRCTTKTFAKRVREQLGDVPITMAAHLETIDTLNEQIAAVEAQMAHHAKSEKATRLQQIAGVGPIVAVAFLAAIDDPARFPSANKLASYIGLSPGENTTGGGKQRRTGVVASGQALLRTVLVQAAHSMLCSRRTREPMAAWAQELIVRRGRKVAVCALARRLAIVMWAMLRDGTRYDPTKTKSRHPRPSPIHDTDTNSTELVEAIRAEAAATSV